MIRRIVFIIMAVLLTGALFLVPDGGAGDKTVNIRFSTWHVPAGADVQKLWIPMLEEMKKRSNGRIT